MIRKDTPLKQVLKIGEHCDQCGHCCRFASGFLVNEDTTKISKHLKISEEKLKKQYLEPVTKFNTKLYRPKTKKTSKPYGPCIWFNEKTNKGKIHKVKPLQCKMCNCKEHGEDLCLWFALNHFLNPHDPESVRQYALYMDTGGKTLPGGELKNIIKDKEMLKKMLNYEVFK